MDFGLRESFVSSLGECSNPSPTLNRQQDLIFRAPLSQDVEAVSALGRDTFCETFAHLYRPEDLSRFLEQAYAPDALAPLIEDQNQFWRVLEDPETRSLIGYVQAGACTLPHPLVTPSCSELKRFYIRQSHQGLGLGGRLITQALHFMTTEFSGDQWIGVWSENHGAQRLYGRYGFTKAGEYGFAVGDQLDLEFILRRDRPCS